MIAGRTRFYVVAGIAGAIAGQLAAAALAIAIAVVAERVGSGPRQLLPLATILVLGGVIGGAWGGVTLLRRWYAREAARRSGGVR